VTLSVAKTRHAAFRDVAVMAHGRRTLVLKEDNGAGIFFEMIAVPVVHKRNG
jgi:hypothetical protein